MRFLHLLAGPKDGRMPVMAKRLARGAGEGAGIRPKGPNVIVIRDLPDVLVGTPETIKALV